MSSLLTTWGKQDETQVVVQEFNETILFLLLARIPYVIHKAYKSKYPEISDTATETAFLLYPKGTINAQILL